jgi:hypothetical protein
MTPTAVSTPPASRGRQRARTARARGIRPTTVSSAPVRIHLRIRLLRVNGGAPYLLTEPADWLHTRFRRCDRSLITAPCHPKLRSACPQWYASALFRSVPRRAVGASAPRSSSLTSDLRITSAFSCVGREFKAPRFLQVQRVWRRSLAVDGGSGTSRGHASTAQSIASAARAPRAVWREVLRVWPYPCLLPIGANSATLGPGLSRPSSRVPSPGTCPGTGCSAVTGGLDETGPARTMMDREQTRLHL